MTPAEQPDDVDLRRRFAGVTRLYGDQAADRFRAGRVVVVGIGGVGSWAAEALARSAVGHLTFVDLDHVAESNTNRQIHALGDTYGKAKVDAMAERARAINPACAVRAIDEFASIDNAAGLVEGVDVVLDCIDQVIVKVALIAAAKEAGVPIVTCGAAGGRFDPTRVRCDDLARLSGDPLLAKVRHKLRRDHGFPPDDTRRKAAAALRRHRCVLGRTAAAACAGDRCRRQAGERRSARLRRLRIERGSDGHHGIRGGRPGAGAAFRGCARTSLTGVNRDRDISPRLNSGLPEVSCSNASSFPPTGPTCRTRPSPRRSTWRRHSRPPWSA